MTFKDEFTPIERVQLLERWILVHSYIYYEMNCNIVPDYVYDANCRQLFELRIEVPKAWKLSRYYWIFKNFEPGCTSGFDLLHRTKQIDRQLLNDICGNAKTALYMKDKLDSQ